MAIPFATSEIVTATELNELARAHWRKTTAKQVVNTITETDLLNGEITIDAGAMSANRALRLTAEGDWINNTGATVNFPRFKLKLGAATLIDTGAATLNMAASASRFGWRLVAEIQNTATNVQWVTFSLQSACGVSAANSTALTTGEGLFLCFNAGGSNGLAFWQGSASGAVDTTAAQALAFTVTLATANALEDVTLKSALVEIV